MSRDPDALVGHSTRDDAAVYRLSEGQAVVETVDFFTPVVDDAYSFGRIAAANAMSDIWAMGARALFALNIVGWPVATLPLELLGEVLKGAADAAAEAGIPILGGHSIDDPEPKFGMAVTGLVHPDRILRNVGAREGDVLLLTKPLGTGIVATAIKRQQAPPEVVARAVASMSALNKTASEVLVKAGGVRALTDVTGFGLLGHGWELAEGSGVALELWAERIPLLPGTLELAAQDFIPGGSKANLRHVTPHLEVASGLDALLPQVLADAQTNGGLLAAVDPARADEAHDALLAAGVAVARIGVVRGGLPGLVVTSRE